MTGRALKAKRVTAADRGLRRRLVTLSLGLAPGDLPQTTGVHPVTISGVLNGSRRLQPAQAASVGKMIARRARELFAA